MKRSGKAAFIGIAVALAASRPALATDGDLRSVSGMLNHNRILLVFAPTLADQRLAVQRRTFAHFAPEAATRDLLLVQVADGTVIGAHDESGKLREHYGTRPGRYRTLLIGKDGNVVLDRPGPIDEATIRAVIDAMPMRQAEIRRARAGHGKAPD